MQCSRSGYSYGAVQAGVSTRGNKQCSRGGHGGEYAVQWWVWWAQGGMCGEVDIGGKRGAAEAGTGGARGRAEQ